MARGGRKPPKRPVEEKPPAATEPGFRPFGDALKGLKAPAGTPKVPAPAAGAKSQPQPGPPPKREKSDEDLLREGMAGVRPLSERERERVPRRKEAPTSAPRFDEDTEALATLAALVDGQEPMTWEHSDEHSEWIAEDADPGILQRLVAGEFAWQAHIDLHGLTRDPARDALVRFLAGARVQGFRCVLIVHGRGHHSEDSKAVLKPLVQRWLQRAPLKEWVFAYATAKPVDGGAGAMYVLLRR